MPPKDDHPRSSQPAPKEGKEPPEGPRGAGRPRPAQAPFAVPRSFLILMMVLGAFLVLDRFVLANAGAVEIPYDTFIEKVRGGKVRDAEVGPQEITGSFKAEESLDLDPDPEKEKVVKVKRFRVFRVHNHPELVSLLSENKVAFSGYADNSVLTQMVFWGLLFVLLFAGWFFMLRRLSPQRQVMSFGRSKARMVVENSVEARFSDVAGIDEVKEELEEVILFLRDAGRFERIGARIPRGVLLVGSPGTGKTLLAKAVAGEASVPFFSLSGSDFVEMFAGVGASRVRDLFEQAQKNSPCIIFIDELDAIGKVRGIGYSGAHDEREQTLNQLLSEMDGFDRTQGIIILAATNRPEILDPALMRAGRFDRRIVVGTPDIKGRIAILEIHAAKVKLEAEVDLEAVAKTCPGFVGADLANLVNEAALLAARREKPAVTMAEFEAAMERIVAGLERRNRVMRPQEKKRIAVHETGHALVALAREFTDPVHRVSIVSRGEGALGYTMQLPEEDRYLMTRRELEERIEVMLGGRVAEQVVFLDVSTGASDDLRRAVSLARRMVLEFGMTQAFGAAAFGGGRRATFLAGAEPDQGPPNYSEETSQEIDREIRRIVQEAEERVVALLEARKPALEAISELLIEKETLDARELLEAARDAGAEPHPLKLADLTESEPATAAPEDGSTSGEDPDEAAEAEGPEA